MDSSDNHPPGPRSLFDDSDPLLIDRMICFPLYAASNLMMRAYRPVLADLGLTYPQYLVMLVLWESAPQSVGALGERLHLDSGTLTPVLKRMEAAGFVVRLRDSSDERRVLISPTPAGIALRERALHIPRTLADGLGLADQDQVAVRDAVQSLVAALSGHKLKPGV